MLSVLLRFATSDYLFGIFTLLTIVLSVLLRFATSDYLFGIFTLLTIALSVLLRFVTSDYLFGIFTLLTIVLSVLLRFATSDYLFDIFKTFLAKYGLQITFVLWNTEPGSKALLRVGFCMFVLIQQISSHLLNPHLFKH